MSVFLFEKEYCLLEPCEGKLSRTVLRGESTRKGADLPDPTLAKTLFYQFCKNRKAGKLPDNCGFRIVNFTDVEYSNRINPIQRKYIPDLAAASETAATLLASLNKGGGEKKGGSEAFFTNSAENFLAAIIYFFVNFHPVGFRNGKRLKRFVSLEGKKLELVIRNWDDFNAVNEEGNVVLDFVDENGNDVSTDEDRMFVELNGFSYKDRTGKRIVIDRCWYEDEEGNEVEPDTVTGEYSDMPHVLSFLGRPYDQVFNILMQDDKIASLMAPFKSAYENKANDQLEGMVGTLRVNAARLVSPEAYWVFTGDDFDLKISDREHPSYLVIANDPEKEQVIGSLNALVLNRLITRVNSKGNIPVSIIVDELPTLYFHKIDRLIGTARSNKVAVTLGFPEGLHHHIGEDGLPRPGGEDCGHGYRLAGRPGGTRLHGHGRKDAQPFRHRAVGRVQDHEVFLQDALRHEEDKGGGRPLRSAS